jgi:hypothetical protein
MKDDNKTSKLLYTNKHGNIYEGDIVECFDIVAFEVKLYEGVKLPTQKSIQTARVIGKIKTSNSP